MVIPEDLIKRRVGLLNDAIKTLGPKKVCTSGGRIMCAVGNNIHGLIILNNLLKLVTPQ